MMTLNTITPPGAPYRVTQCADLGDGWRAVTIEKDGQTIELTADEVTALAITLGNVTFE